MGGRITNSEAQLQPDPRYQDKLVAKFVNCIMYDGKKATAQKVVYQAFDTIQARLEKEKLDTLPRTAIEVFQKAIENVKPVVEVRSKRVGGANYQVPMQLNRRRAQSLTFRWIIDAARARSNKEFHTFQEKLLAELTEASKNQGQAVAKKLQTEKLAEANKAFSHLKW